jgi:hypothetical protein
MGGVGVEVEVEAVAMGISTTEDVGSAVGWDVEVEEADADEGDEKRDAQDFGGAGLDALGARGGAEGAVVAVVGAAGAVEVEVAEEGSSRIVDGMGVVGVVEGVTSTVLTATLSLATLTETIVAVSLSVISSMPEVDTSSSATFVTSSFSSSPKTTDPDAVTGSRVQRLQD